MINQDEHLLCKRTDQRVGLEQAKQPGSFGQFREQRAPISNQPAIKGAISHSLERKQNGQGDDFAGVQVGLWMFRESFI